MLKCSDRALPAGAWSHFNFLAGHGTIWLLASGAGSGRSSARYTYRDSVERSSDVVFYRHLTLACWRFLKPFLVLFGLLDRRTVPFVVVHAGTAWRATVFRFCRWRPSVASTHMGPFASRTIPR